MIDYVISEIVKADHSSGDALCDILCQSCLNWIAFISRVFHKANQFE